MPLCTIHLLSFTPTTTLPTFLRTLSSTSLKPLTIAQVIRWIILPSELSTSELLAQNIHWDVLLIVPSTDPLPESLQPLTAHQWSITAGVPSRLLVDYKAKNKKLLHPDASSIPSPTGSLSNPKISSSAQDLSLSPELRSWIESFSTQGSHQGGGAVSMLNLLAFKDGMKESYLKYGAEFAKSIGSRRGGNAKIVGTAKDREHGWDEVALAHYPSITHFADMLASEDYQAVNQKYRVPALRDTCILCTSEVGVEEMGWGLWSKEGGSKL